jgi:hypothetical protein
MFIKISIVIDESGVDVFEELVVYAALSLSATS